MLLLLALCAGGRARAEAPCAEDSARLCPGIPQGDGRLWACLEQHQLQLSSPCVRNIQEVQRRASEFGADCGADVYRFCPSIRPGQDRILQCLGAQSDRLSPRCRRAVNP